MAGSVKSSSHYDYNTFGRILKQVVDVINGVASSMTTSTNSPTQHGGIYTLNRATGVAVTLPAATATGLKQRFIVETAASGGSYVISAAGTDVFTGIVLGERADSGNAVLGFAAGATDNTITLSSTNGGVSKGSWVEVIDVASGVWAVTGILSSTGGAFATPFSHV